MNTESTERNNMNNNGKRVVAPRLGMDVYLCKPAETDNSSDSPRSINSVMQEKVSQEAVTTSDINLLLFKGSHMAGEDTQVFLQVQGESFRANCSYDIHKHSHEKKFWCKEQSERYCPDLSLSFPSEGIGRNHAPYHPVELRDSGGGWFSVIMTALRKEDSGTYQCGVWVETKQVLLQRIQMVVSPKETVTVFAKKGKSLFLHCSYSVTVNIRELFIWCKMVSRIRCQPIIRGNADQSIVKAERTEMMNDFSWKMIRVWLKKLQLNDSGEYHLESRFQGRNKLLKRIVLKVLGEKWNMDASPIDNSRKNQRIPYAAMVLISLLATAVLIATVTLITSRIRKKRAGKEMDFDRHPAFTKGVLQNICSIVLNFLPHFCPVSPATQNIDYQNRKLSNKGQDPGNRD
ncbi:hypothetical protein CIB84_005257 [Bambusicola thoracicus]|uniref:Immunoglobulin domain-containing protein n=1 Tax=Bambusicola thoracicus TaxID=9083 RepID=A0A2P4T3R6_BAMTH|nr:hypothetical protein CIB84_005257 [Bambusicola thoracicus]